MNGVGTTQLDILLNFSKLYYLNFSAGWELTEVHPPNKSFLGWDIGNVSSFDFQRDFLEPNKLDLEKFLGHFNSRDYVIKNYFWLDVDGKIIGPCDTYFRIRKEKGKIDTLMAFVKLSREYDKISILPEEKSMVFISRFLPGFIHNINGPLGTSMGRVELLHYKYPQIEGLNEIMKMNYKLQSLLKNLSFKLVHEKEFEPVEINLNRLLREELTFLNCDLFYKHQVELRENFVSDIPQFQMPYIALSGIMSEGYHFMRRFVDEDQDYSLEVGSIYQGEDAGFYMNFLGEFNIPGDLRVRFPVNVEGDGIMLAQQKLNGIDNRFLSFCLRRNGGYLKISGRREIFSLHLEFPLPKS